jgi:hypothetical protein
MKYREPVAVGPAAVGIVYLTHVLDELLYEYTHSSYKPRVMSCNSLCKEALRLADSIDRGVVDRSRIEPILEEFKEVLRRDEVAKNLLEFEVDYYLSFSKDTSLENLTNRLGLLHNKVGGRGHVKALQGAIADACADAKRKKEISELARSWVSEVCSHGYTRKFMHETLINLFFLGDSRIHEPSDLHLFFDIFDGSKSQFEIAFLVEGMISNVGQVATRLRANILDKEGEHVAKFEELGFKSAQDERYVVFTISALDAHGARSRAEMNMEHLTDLFALYHHKRKITWNPQVAARESPDGDWRLLGYLSSGAKRSKDNLPFKASAKLISHFKELTFPDPYSAGRFFSIVRMHGSAQESLSAQAQLVNFWTGMEVLVDRGSSSKLKGVIAVLVPFLSFGYVESLLQCLTGDIFRWNRAAATKLINVKELRGWRLQHKLAAILLGGQFEKIREALYALVAPYPLLCNRVFVISQMLSSADKLLEVVQAHERRLVWQIHRIYRARNLIVHDGSAPQFVDLLVENAHEYLDAFIERFLHLRTVSKSAYTIEEAVEFQSKLYSEWIRKLRDSGGAAVTLESIYKFAALA